MVGKSHLGPLPAGRPTLPIEPVGADWRDTPTIKARLAGGYCLHAAAQGACPYANICEHCPSFRTDASHLGVLAAQRVDADALAADAAARGWGAEADRHRKTRRPPRHAHRASRKPDERQHPSAS